MFESRDIPEEFSLNVDMQSFPSQEEDNLSLE